MKKLLTFLIVYPLTALLALRAGTAVTGFLSIGEFFTGVSPLAVVTTLAAGFAVASYLLGAVTNDYSWVDRLWSTAPVLFAWVYAVRSSLATGPTVAALLISVWGLRLTFNFARRGGYTTIEDYRWPIVKEKIGNPILWQLFNLLFISAFQLGLFILFTAPVYRLSTLAGSPSILTLAAGGAALLVLLSIETTADQQQWTFQNIKHGNLPAEDPPGWFAAPGEDPGSALQGDLERGFLTHGLFRFSRHPNYFGELGVWWTVFIVAGVAAGGFLHWSGLGAVLLTALFVGSTRLTESISASKYPRYAMYQDRTSPIIPWLPAPPAGEEARAD